MITNEFRPNKFNEVAGQELNVRILQSIIKNPINAPKTIILQGQFGTGKTTLARIFARALNCERATNQPCMKCSNCKGSLDTSTYYTEYDSAVVGSIDKIRELRDTFFYSIANGYKVIVFDEVHLVSKAAQSALLKVLEETPARVFFLLCTTDVDKILPTIRSRSMELRFEGVKEEEIIKNLKNIIEVKEVEVSEDILITIAKKSRGHMRDAHMFLDQYLMIGDRDFRETVKSAQDYFIHYFEGIAQKNKDKVFKSINELLTFPLAELLVDYQEVISNISKVMVGYMEDEEIEPIVKLLGADVLKLIKLSIADWVMDSFNSDITLQTALLCVYQMMSQIAVSRPNTQNAMQRAARR